MKIKSNPEWDEKSNQDKRLSILGIILAFTVLILAALQMSGVVRNTSVIFVPLMGLLMLVQSMQMWKTRRVVAILCIIAAVFLFLCSMLFALAL